MSLLLASGRRNSEKCSSNGLCCYCNNVFKDPRALGGHLRAHKGQAVSKKNWNAPSRSRNSLNVTRPKPKPLKAAPLESSAGGSGSNQRAVLGKGKPPIFPKRFGHEHWSNNKPTPKLTANTNYPNYSSGSDKAEAPWSSQVPDLSSFTNPSYAPLNHSSPSGSDVVYQSKPNPSSSLDLGNHEHVSGNGILKIEDPNKGTYAVPIPDTHNGSRWSVSGVPTSAFFPYQDRFPEQGRFEEYNKNPVLAPRNPVLAPRYPVLAPRGKKGYPSEASELPAMMYPPRRMEPNLVIEPEMRQKKQARELLLYKDLGKHFSGLEKFIYASEEAETDLDLSLHL